MMRMLSVYTRNYCEETVELFSGNALDCRMEQERNWLLRSYNRDFRTNLALLFYGVE